MKLLFPFVPEIRFNFALKWLHGWWRRPAQQRNGRKASAATPGQTASSTSVLFGAGHTSSALPHEETWKILQPCGPHIKTPSTSPFLLKSLPNFLKQKGMKSFCTWRHEARWADPSAQGKGNMGGLRGSQQFLGAPTNHPSRLPTIRHALVM